MTGRLSDTQYFKAIFMFKYTERDSKKKHQTGPEKSQGKLTEVQASEVERISI